jgi:hypothetical protein
MSQKRESVGLDGMRDLSWLRRDGIERNAALIVSSVIKNISSTMSEVQPAMTSSNDMSVMLEHSKTSSDVSEVHPIMMALVDSSVSRSQ